MNNSWRLQQAFTLFEILIVMLIIAIASSVVFFRFGGAYAGNENKQFVEQFINQIHLAKSRAVFYNNTIGVKIASKHYQFVKLDSVTTKWQLMAATDVLSAKPVPEDLQFVLEGGGKSQHQAPAILPQVPQIIFTANGYSDTYKVYLNQGVNSVAIITVAATGDIKIEK